MSLVRNAAVGATVLRDALRIHSDAGNERVLHGTRPDVSDTPKGAIPDTKNAKNNTDSEPPSCLPRFVHRAATALSDWLRKASTVEFVSVENSSSGS